MGATRPSDDRVELAVCAIVRDEASYLAEWVAFHHLQGVQRFLLYDNGSRDTPEEALAAWIACGRVQLQPWAQSLDDGGQEAAYTDALHRLRGRARWVAFVDADEFLHHPGGVRLPEVLSGFGAAAGVGVRWQVYGSDGHVERLPGLVTQRFTRRAPTQWVRNRRIKCIVDPERVTRPVGPHWFEPAGSAPIVDEAGRPLQPHPVSAGRVRLREVLATVHPRAGVDPYARRDFEPTDVRVQLLRINHYAVKSRAEYRAKRTRFVSGAAPGSDLVERYDQRYFTYHDRNDVHDPQPARTLRALVAALDGPP